MIPFILGGGGENLSENLANKFKGIHAPVIVRKNQLRREKYNLASHTILNEVL
jgi:hypothetical protein